MAAVQPEMVQVDGANDLHLPRRSAESLEIRRGIAFMNAAFDWTGPDDPDNPRDFSIARRIFIVVTVTLLAFCATLAASIYAPAQDYVAEAFDCSYELAVLPLAFFNAGLAFGPLIGAPLSETYGRKAVFLVTMPVFALFSVGAGFSNSIASMTVCRFFAAMFAAPLISNASAVILDCTVGRGRGISLGLYYAMPTFGTGMGPFVGGFIVTSIGWRWVFWVSIMLTAVLYIPVWFTKETYKKVILQRRAVRLGQQDSSSQSTSPGRAIRYFANVLIQRPIHMLFTEPIVTFVSLYNGFLFGLNYAFVIAVPWIFEHYYGFDRTAEALTFLSLCLGTILATVPLILTDLGYYQKRWTAWRQNHPDERDQFPPEHRLMPAMAGSIILPIGLLAAAWTAQMQVHWIVPMIFQAAVMFGSLLVYAGANLFMLDAYGPLYGASASGAMMLTRYTFSAGFPLFTLQMYEALGTGWATSLLAFVTLALAPIPWCFWFYGEKLRQRSRYEFSP